MIRARSTEQLTGTLKCYIECKQKEKVIYSNSWKGRDGSGSACVWEEYFDIPRRVKELTLTGYVLTDGT